MMTARTCLVIIACAVGCAMTVYLFQKRSMEPRAYNVRSLVQIALDPHGRDRYGIKINGNTWLDILGVGDRYLKVDGTNLIAFLTGSTLDSTCTINIVRPSGEQLCKVQ